MQIATPRPIEWPTLAMLVATYAVWMLGTSVWHLSGPLAMVMTVLAIAQFSSLQHEVLHGHPFANQRLNEALVFPALTLVVPYIRFRDMHLQHHHDPSLTDPYVLLWLWSYGDMPVLAYIASAYMAYGLLKIRTYLEHRAHDAFCARTVIVEDRGPLALLFLNNSLHVVHHMHPKVAWYQLPGLYAARRAHYQRRNQAYVYRSYAQIFRAHLFKAKDPVPHPIWPVRKSGSTDQD